MAMNSEHLGTVSSHEWQKRLGSNNFDKLSGAYSLILMTPTEIRIITDNLNLRKIYYAQHESTWIISTHIFWINNLIKSTINWQELGKVWYIEQVGSCASLINNVHTLAGGDELIINEEARLQKNVISFNKHTASFDILTNKLAQSIDALLNDKISLGLTGGLDSRTILSFLINSNKSFSCHTFGEAKNYDVRIAQDLAKLYHFEHNIYNNKLSSDVDSLVKRLQQLTLDSEMMVPLVSHQLFDYFDTLHSNAYTMIDGGFLNLLRRTAQNRIMMRHKWELLTNNPKKIFPVFQKKRPAIFDAELENIFEKACLESFSDILAANPITKSTKLGDWIDKTTIKWSNPYKFAPANKLYDEHVPTVMIGAQKHLIDLFLSFPQDIRQGGKLNYRIMKKMSKEQLKIPFVRYDTLIPKVRGIYYNYLIAKLNIKRGKFYDRKERPRLLAVLKPWLYDTIASPASLPPEIKLVKIKQIIDDYYQKDNKIRGGEVLQIIQIIFLLAAN